MSLTIDITSDAAAIVKALTGYPQKLAEAIAAAMDVANQESVGRIQKDRMSFSRDQPPVSQGTRAVSSRLRNSVRATKARASINSVTSSIGSNIKYAGRQEFGFTGTESVKSFTRRTPSGKTAHVRSFTRRANTPARAPISRGIEDNLGAYSSHISEAIVASWDELKGGLP